MLVFSESFVETSDTPRRLMKGIHHPIGPVVRVFVLAEAKKVAPDLILGARHFASEVRTLMSTFSETDCS